MDLNDDPRARDLKAKFRGFIGALDLSPAEKRKLPRDALNAVKLWWDLEMKDAPPEKTVKADYVAAVFATACLMTNETFQRFRSWELGEHGGDVHGSAN